MRKSKRWRGLRKCIGPHRNRPLPAFGHGHVDCRGAKSGTLVQFQADRAGRCCLEPDRRQQKDDQHPEHSF